MGVKGLRLKKATGEKLLRVSAATVERLLKPGRRKFEFQTAGTLLKDQVSLRSFSEWDEAGSGFMGLELVSHEGGSCRGDFCFSFKAIDGASGWTDTEAIRNRAQLWAFQALEKIRARMVGSLRYDTEEELRLLNQLYSRVRLDYNFFQVTMKLWSKQRQGSRVRKRDGQPKTSCQRLLESGYFAEGEKNRLW